VIGWQVATGSKLKKHRRFRPMPDFLS
jgi:8-oxo-dGTP pyrophosphatase MutT (NUDIX family)